MSTRDELAGVLADTLNKQFKENQKNEKEFLDGITKKYGEGVLNPETGVFTKNNS